MSYQVTIVENSTKYSTEDMNAWIREMEWYVDRITSYDPDGINRSSEQSNTIQLHVTISNYASHSIDNRFKQEWQANVCPLGTEDKPCRCEHADLKIINPDRLVGSSAMHSLAQSLTGSARIADMDVMLDWALWMGRTCMWGTTQELTTSSIWSLGWRRSDTSMVARLTKELHARGLAIGIQGKPTWDHGRAESVRHEILQHVFPMVDDCCLTSTKEQIDHMEKEVSRLVKSFQSLRTGHRANGTVGEVKAEEELRACLTNLLNSLNEVK